MIEINNTTAFAIDKASLLKIARTVLAKEKKKAGISIAFVSPQKAKELNMRYREKNYVPSVLSFTYGEVVLCPFVIRKDAKKYGITFKRELARVFVHGLLHVLGYGHAAIKKKEKEYAYYSWS